MRATAVILLAFIAPSALAADRGFLCTTELSTGFRFNDLRWKPFRFASLTTGYVVRPFDTNELAKHKPFKWGVFSISLGDSKEPDWLCAAEQASTMRCSGGYGEFLFDPKSKRLVYSDYFNYLSGTVRENAGVTSEFGTCDLIP